MDEQKVREAIEWLEGRIEQYEAMFENWEGRYGNRIKQTIRCCETAIEALEKQLPKKLIEHHYEEQGEALYVKYGCGNGCKIQPSRSSKYCNQCGQRLDWSEQS